jgi:carbonic anhydrase/acetyltransferase-like protein (isoleucine patch superfamily)
VIGEDCIVGHNAYLRGCEIARGVLVGSMSTVLPRCRVGEGAVIAAGAVLTIGTEVPPRGLARGVPAAVVPDGVEPGRWAFGPQRYVENARRYAAELRLIR